MCKAAFTFEQAQLAEAPVQHRNNQTQLLGKMRKLALFTIHQAMSPPLIQRERAY